MLADRRELALVAVERTRMPMVITDPRQPDNPIVLANNAFLELTGYTAPEVLGRNCRFLQGPGTSAGEIAALRQQLAAKADEISVELLNYRKDGSSFWNQLIVSPVRDEQGELIYYFASQKDVSARRRAQEHEITERLLLKEVDHRAMNALAMVQSIVRLSRRDSVEQFSTSVIGRVDALARAHRLLAAGGWAGIDLATLLAMEAAQMGIDAQGPETMLPAHWVQPVTLLFHELISNAKQHGAGRDQNGSLIVRWESGPRGISLHWTEARDRTGQDAPQSGLGLNLMRGIVEQQLGGRLEMAWSADGLRADISIPWQRQTAKAE